MDSTKPSKYRRRATIQEGSQRPCVGLEAEFTLYVDGKETKARGSFW